ncbi:response regulator [Rheinheimera marina]|uniref:Response regulator n=1 Tax=Rheinheimera marina TaxID=1774958 RepID=A0ABV9JMU2_9GAMM
MKLRALLLTTLFAMALIGLAGTLSWHSQWQQQERSRSEAEQQLLTSLSLMVEPLLVKGAAEQIKANLLSSSFASTLPLKSILVFDAGGQLFAASQGYTSNVTWSLSKNMTGRQSLPDGSDLLWSAVLVSPASMVFFEPGAAKAEGEVLGYVALQIAPLQLHASWYHQSAYWLVALLLTAAMLALMARKYKTNQQRMMMDLNRELHLLLQRPAPAVAGDALWAELQNALTELNWTHHSLKGQVAERLALAGPSKEQFDELQAHCTALAAQLSESQQLQQQELAWQRQWQHSLGLLQGVAEAELKSQLEFGQMQLHFLQRQAQPELWSPGNWFQAETLQWRPYLQKASAELVLVEDPALHQAGFELDVPVLTWTCRAIMQLVCTGMQGQSLTWHWYVQNFQDHSLLLQWDFAGRSTALQFLQSDDPQQPLLPAQRLVLQLIKQAGYKVRLSCLEELGCSLVLEIPLHKVWPQPSDVTQTMAYLDAQPARSAILKPALYALAEQVFQVQRPAELLLERKLRLLDLVVIQLPDDGDGEELRQVLLQLDCPVVAFASPHYQARWRSELSCPVLSQPLQIRPVRQLPQQQQHQPRILLVDDNETNLAFVQALLARQSLKLDTATTGQKAVQLAKTNHYQMILLDIQLPDMQGTVVAQQIRQLPHHQHSLILAFTAHALPAERDSFLAAGMDDVVLKPLDIHKIADLLQRCKALAEMA